MKISATSKVSDFLLKELNEDIEGKVIDNLCTTISGKILKYFESSITKMPNKEYGIDYSLELHVFTDKELKDFIKRIKDDKKCR